MFGTITVMNIPRIYSVCPSARQLVSCEHSHKIKRCSQIFMFCSRSVMSHERVWHIASGVRKKGKMRLKGPIFTQSSRGAVFQDQRCNKTRQSIKGHI